MAYPQLAAAFTATHANAMRKRLRMLGSGVGYFHVACAHRCE